MIELNVKNLLAEVPEYNKFGEKVTVVAAVKLQTVEDINRAIAAGITDIGDNHVQEFKEKYEYISGSPRRHFIGRLQTNKVKYLIGKVDLYHSVDRLNLAEEISKRSLSAGITSEILVQVNAGNEESKGGFSFEEVEDACRQISAMPNLKIRGLMAMLPFTEDCAMLKRLATLMREKYENLKTSYRNFDYLSMGMSGDWRICVDCGSNMIRVGTTIFGARNYDK